MNYFLHKNEEDRKKLEKRSGRLYHRIFPFRKRESKKSGDNSDWKVILSSECTCNNRLFNFYK
ncbi:hypothetical protein DN757_22660 [Paenibacillus silvae]|uniref:Uncharacterized protein n=1 Tax=Paenibacillus silvae TaxID=1325358 RepID=A0A2W6NET5_9BACL|nr:hypothetical protein DN757_22660 [Paenibacillus silvae]